MWQSLKGYVMIRIEGWGLERFLNSLLRADIPVWNVRRISPTQVTAEMRVKDFFRLHTLRQGRRCRIHVLERRGMPFILAKLRKRKALIASMLICAALLAVAQTRIWFIGVEGLNDVPHAVVEEALTHAGVKAGMTRYGIETLALGSTIRAQDSRIAWAGVQVDGIAMRIQVVEAEILPELPDKSKPADVVAMKDGIIEQVTALSGKADIQPGDAVRTGDVLIRGDITREGASEQLLVHAEGEVLAKVGYVATVTLNDIQKQWLPSGKEEPYRALYVAGIPVYQSTTGFERFRIDVKRDNMVRGLVLPVRQARGSFQELSLQEVPVDRDELVAEAMFMAELQALSQVPEDVRILEKTSMLRTNDDGSVQAVAYVYALEKIGEARPIS